MSAFITDIQHSIRSPCKSFEARKRNSVSSNWKQGIKSIAVCQWHDFMHRNTKGLNKETKLTGEFGSVEWYKISEQINGPGIQK